MAQYQAAPAAPPADYPGKTLGIVGLVLAIVASFVGLIISIIAFRQSKAAGYTNGIAKAGIIVGIITTVLSVIFSIFYIVALMALSQAGTR
jgi:hypothetical protein